MTRKNKEKIRRAGSKEAKTAVVQCIDTEDTLRFRVEGKAGKEKDDCIHPLNKVSQKEKGPT